MSTELVNLIDSTKESFVSRLSDKSISFEVEAGFAIQALSTDYATKIALSNRQSVIDAVTNVSAIGVSLNPAKKQAYLVPRDGKICLDISYMGLIDIAVATGSILWAQAAVVYAEDEYLSNGLDVAPTHKFNPFNKGRGEKVGVYVVVKTPNGDYLTHAMSIADVYSIRDRSQSWKAGKSTPWKSDEDEMIKKTCVKQAYKYWPKTSEAFKQALQYLNVEAGEGFEAINNQPTRKGAPPPKEIEIDITKQANLINALEVAARNGHESFMAAWRLLTDTERNIVTRPEADRIKADAIAATRPIDASFVAEMETANG